MVVDPAESYKLDLSSLEQAVLVLDHGSFRKAADLLGVRPSVVSRRVRALEDGIGVSLFQRQSHGTRPTIAGRRLLGLGLTRFRGHPEAFARGVPDAQDTPAVFT